MTNELDDFNKIPVKQRNNESKLEDKSAGRSFQQTIKGDAKFDDFKNKTLDILPGKLATGEVNSQLMDSERVSPGGQMMQSPSPSLPEMNTDARIHSTQDNFRVQV